MSDAIQQARNALRDLIEVAGGGPEFFAKVDRAREALAALDALPLSGEGMELVKRLYGRARFMRAIGAGEENREKSAQLYEEAAATIASLSARVGELERQAQGYYDEAATAYERRNAGRARAEAAESSLATARQEIDRLLMELGRKPDTDLHRIAGEPMNPLVAANAPTRDFDPTGGDNET